MPCHGTYHPGYRIGRPAPRPRETSMNHMIVMCVAQRDQIPLRIVSSMRGEYQVVDNEMTSFRAAGKPTTVFISIKYLGSHWT